MRSLIIFLLGIVPLTVCGYHIVGGEMYFDCLGNNVYRIQLQLYRDCAAGPNAADYDVPAYFGVYDSIGDLIFLDSAFYTNRDTIPLSTGNPCFAVPANLCVEKADYTFIDTLPPIPGGYDIVYSRCCRNSSVINIQNPDQVGATYTVHIDPLNVNCDHSPRFTTLPPVVICAGVPLVVDQSATDADNDSLVYSFYTPYIGGDPTVPQPIPGAPPPFTTVVWASPYGLTNLIGGNPAMTINAQTGIINANPSVQGRFVVGIMVQEYRNGVLIGTVRRDFQFNITPCPHPQAIIPVIDTTGAAATNTTGEFTFGCDSLTVAFINQSINTNSYWWDFGDASNSADTSVAFQPSYTYPDTGIYIVTLIVSKGLSCADTTKVYVRIYPGFKTNYGFAPDCENHPLSFFDSTYTRYGFVNSWTWHFGDGQSSNVQNPQHLFNDGGVYPVELISTNSKGCIDSVTKQVTVYPIAKGSILNSPACLDEVTKINTNATIKSGSIVSYLWNLGNGSDPTVNPTSTVFTVLGPDSITLIMISDIGCRDTLDTTLTVTAPPTVTTVNDTAICINLSVPLNANGAVSYAWSPGTGLSNAAIANPVATPADTTQYTVIGTDAVGCTASASMTIDIWPLPPTNAGPDTFVCIGFTYEMQGSGGASFSWSPAKYMSDTSVATPVISPDSAITYYLTSKSTFGCVNHDSVHISVEYHLNPALAGPGTLCLNDTIQLIASGGKYYLWTPPGISNNTDSASLFSPADNTTYTVRIYNDCFSVNLPKEIIVHQLPLVKAEKNDTILRDETDTLSVSGAETYTWRPGGINDSTGTTIVVSPFNTTTYVATGTDLYGCKNSDSVFVFVKVKNLLLVPTAFSPNGDGKNDVFRIVRRLNIQELLEFSIYNRWGEKVFETTDLDTGWDGTFQGKPQEIGVFVYFIRALNRDGKTITEKGNFTLIR